MAKRPIDAVNDFQAVTNATPVERMVFGSAMSDPEVMSTISDHFHRGDMGSNSHQIIWDEMVVLHRENILSQDSLINSLSSRGTLAGIGTQN
jgi:replicative DNA helicase